MKKIFFITLFCSITFISYANKKYSPIRATYNLIERVTPGYGKQFKLELIDSEKDEDTYEISQEKGKILLKGNNAIALATAFNQYLKYHCNAHLSWFGDQLSLPHKLPLPTQSTRNTINGKYRVYFNYCTISYSAPWWNWERWQREIDFMAMNSINMPLSVIGLEAVWYNTLLKHKFTDGEARRFLAGPAHAAWQWMQNIQSYGGPLPKSWIDKHIVLGKQIIERELELGMQPIQQGFSGYVPQEMKEKYPQAKIIEQRSWCGFKGAAQLDPTDPLFSQFGRDFLEEQKKLYGAHGVYAADPFHESKPPIETPEYLNAVGSAIYNLFIQFDPNAKWAMQAWSLREHILKAAPKERMIVLDLGGGKSQSDNAFWGYPTIVGNLHNFGGRINLHGDLRLLATNQYETAKKKSPNICGSGLFMEGIEQNPVYYELAFEMPLHHSEVAIEEWLNHYAHRRYGKQSTHSEQAWQQLLKGPYQKGTNGTEKSSIIAARPAIKVKKSGPNAALGIPYSPLILLKAQDLLLKDINLLKGSKPYRFDIVDLQRQIMTNLGQIIHKKAADAFIAKDSQAFTMHSQRFLELLKDVDRLLRTRSEYNFDKWLTNARSWGNTPQEKDLLEKDATSLLTIWGPETNPIIFDYAWREWSGLIDGYYLKRWEMFYEMLQQHLSKGTNYSEEGVPQAYGRESFRANEFYSKMADWELQYVSTPNKARIPITQGDEIEIIQQLYPKYLKLAKEYYGEDAKADTSIDMNIFENLGE